MNDSLLVPIFSIVRKLHSEEAEVVCPFHDLYYRRWQAQGDTINLSWFGYQVWKCPLDLSSYQELLVRTRPDFVIETGMWCGGSALYLALLWWQKAVPGRSHLPKKSDCRFAVTIVLSLLHVFQPQYSECYRLRNQMRIYAQTRKNLDGE